MKIRGGWGPCLFLPLDFLVSLWCNALLTVEIYRYLYFSWQCLHEGVVISYWFVTTLTIIVNYCLDYKSTYKQVVLWWLCNTSGYSFKRNALDSLKRYESEGYVGMVYVWVRCFGKEMEQVTKSFIIACLCSSASFDKKNEKQEK